MLKVLFVCMGNICRSPMAEAVFRHYVDSYGCSSCILTNSAGTHGYNIGRPPDARARQVAQARGYDMSRIYARQVGRTDFSEFDFLVAMDKYNLAELARLRPELGTAELSLLMRYCPQSDIDEVPDPYHGDVRDFERALDLVERGAQSLLDHVINRAIPSSNLSRATE